MSAVPNDLITLARFFGDPANDQCMLGEGNVSMRTGATFWVKASGKAMQNAEADAFVELDLERTLGLIHADGSNEDLRAKLNDCRIDPHQEAIPSTEAIMHAVLLQREGIQFVGHSHPTPLLSILALESWHMYADMRLFPDHIVFCGTDTPAIPYVMPGRPLAASIQKAVSGRNGIKTLWLQNHGLICIGKSVNEVSAAAQMSVKAARALLSAIQTGLPIRAMTQEEVNDIAGWPDEHHRQRMLDKS